MKRFILITATLLLTSFYITCSNSFAIENNFQLWTPVYLQFPIKEKFLGDLEISPRLGNNVTDLSQLIIRPGIGYKLNDNLILWQGYAWAPNFAPKFRNENRIWHRIDLSKNFSKFKLINSFRLEERFIENSGGTSLRGRYTLQIEYPFDTRKLWSLILSNKFYFNFYSVAKGPEGGVEQNRIFIGINKKISDHVMLETGYQLQHLLKKGRPDRRLIHAIISNIYLNF